MKWRCRIADWWDNDWCDKPIEAFDASDAAEKVAEQYNDEGFTGTLHVDVAPYTNNELPTEFESFNVSVELDVRYRAYEKRK